MKPHEADPIRSTADVRPMEAPRPADVGPAERALARPDAPGRALSCAESAKRETKPFTAGGLTLRQHAAVRLLVAGEAVMRIARALSVNKRTLARWRRQAAFAAEAERLRALAAERTIATGRSGGAPRALARPNAPGRARAEGSAGQSGKTKPMPPPVAAAPVQRKPNRLMELVLQLNREGITPFTRVDEYHRRMREAGYEV